MKMTIEEFEEAVDNGGLIDYDGHATLINNSGERIEGWFYPSEVRFIRVFYPEATHVIWHNR